MKHQREVAGSVLFPEAQHGELVGSDEAFDGGKNRQVERIRDCMDFCSTVGRWHRARGATEPPPSCNYLLLHARPAARKSHAWHDFLGALMEPHAPAAGGQGYLRWGLTLSFLSRLFPVSLFPDARTLLRFGACHPVRTAAQTRP